ncbi:tetratricopeptide repeat protein [Sphingomonas sp. IC-11]|uniref:tetratricopeptide repeat protein n=1 Tax=Sphingomonas sp. IC-11 TaxID=2898528 RepID=UPI001E43B87D|nr:tetratricopeptide repeat protein [Sphingomonas sp. IC-11]MCD2315005.1 tetratricopeptide repeat protein [Sphingomonas sp. IC-11]
MSIARPLILAAALAGAPGALAQAYPGQQVQTVPRPTPDADALANAMRRLGSNPRDLSSLIEAAELSLKLGDVNAAASLLKRAENVDPMNGRVKAGMARILVTQERPGEALRYFDQAVGYGLDPRTFAGDRGLAYDLIGEQERAQRDYRVALKSGGTDEVQRRYALSLGISGRRQEALDAIADQLRRNDRSAWRVRAFVLAMTGDVPGAEKIANTMMPPGMGAALAPFFARLGGLSSADRAFAVHFGELRATPQRLADARLVPALPPLPPEATRPVQVASVATAAPVSASASRNDRRSAREEAKRRREAARAEQRAQRDRRSDRPAVAVASATAVRQPTIEPTAFQPPRYAGVAFAPSKPVVQTVPAPASSAAPAAPASAGPLPVSATSTAGSSLAATGGTAPLTAQAVPSRPVSSTLAALSGSASPSATSAAASPAPAVASRPQVLASASSATSTRPGSITPATPAALPASSAAAVTSEPAPAAAIARTAPTRPALSEDTILARIMAGISIPGSELGVAPVRPPEPVAPPVQASAQTGTSSATQASSAAAEAPGKATGTERPEQQERVEPVASRRAATAEKPASSAVKAGEPKLAAANGQGGKAVSSKEKAAADAKQAGTDVLTASAKKQAEAKRLADAKKQADVKKAADAAKAAKAEPARIWVQVAGGANKDDLPKAWAAAQNKAAALKGKSAYTTPLRLTNRVLTGPFKTEQEAREFVNTLSKQGISAFPFTSEEGQKMTRLPAK